MSKRITVGFCFFDYEGYLGGPKINAMRLLPGLVKLGYLTHALILCRDDSYESEFKLTKLGVVVHRRSNSRYTEENVSWILSVCEQIQPDIFVPNHLASACYAAIQLKKQGIPTVGASRSEDTFYEGYGEEFIYGKAENTLSACVTVSNEIYDQLSRQNINNVRLRTIPSGVPTPDNIKIDYHSINLNILYLGRLNQKQKRIYDMLAIFMEMLEYHEGVDITILGNVDYEANREDLLRFIRMSKHQGRLRWEGSIDPEFLIDYLPRFHVITLMSAYEGVPASLMDGMASGLVPIATRNSGSEALIRHGVNGFIMDHPEKEFIEYINLIKEDRSLLRKLSESSYETIKNGFSIEDTLKKWDHLLKEVYEGSKTFTRVRPWDSLELPTLNKKLSLEDIRS